MQRVEKCSDLGKRRGRISITPSSTFYLYNWKNNSGGVFKSTLKRPQLVFSDKRLPIRLAGDYTGTKKIPIDFKSVDQKLIDNLSFREATTKDIIAIYSN